jgi:hypothetical protein
LIEIKVTIHDEHLASFGTLVIGNLIQNSGTGEIIGIGEFSAPGYQVSGAPEGLNVIYAEIVKDTKFNKSGKIKKRVKVGIDGSITRV